ncbi:MFS transporter [Photorhabdus heterorhabditis]|nr:MFS transporter [Photorhabdus heterorhabditis]KOY61670.1 MFS transporter [Photorhabdus heterorhabditis]MBS9443273.1 MFS transporter [Photorhabdus heterorhabditis]
MNQNIESYKWMVLFIATITQACACFFVQGIGSIALLLQQQMSLSAFQIGLLVSSAQLAPLVGLLVAGELLDRFNEKYVVSIGVFLVGITLCFTLFFDNYYAILILLFILGIGYSSAQPGGAKSVSNWFPKNQLGFAMGIRQAGLPLGGALASLILPFLAIRFNWHFAFFASGCIAIFGAMLFFIFYKDKDPKTKKIQHINIISTIRNKILMVKEPAMFNIMLSGACLTSIQYSVVIYLISYFYEELKISPSIGATLLFSALASGVVGRIVLAAWSDRTKTNRYFQVLCCLFCSLIGITILFFLKTDSYYFLFPFMVLLGFFGVGWYGPWVAYIADTAPKDRIGFALGLAMTANQVAVIVIAPLIGILRDITGGYNLSWILLILFTFFTLLSTYFRNKRVLSG